MDEFDYFLSYFNNIYISIIYLLLIIYKIFLCLGYSVVRFQNGSNKVVIELRVMQFGSDIILAISS